MSNHILTRSLRWPDTVKALVLEHRKTATRNLPFTQAVSATRNNQLMAETYAVSTYLLDTSRLASSFSATTYIGTALAT